MGCLETNAEARRADLFRAAWSRDTSADPDGWEPANPAWGQCAVTAVAARRALGGRVLKVTARLPDGQVIGHYFNEIGGRIVDLTACQFPPGTEIPYGEAAPRRRGHPDTAAYVLSAPGTRERYRALRKRLRLSDVRAALTA